MVEFTLIWVEACWKNPWFVTFVNKFGKFKLLCHDGPIITIPQQMALFLFISLLIEEYLIKKNISDNFYKIFLKT